MPRSSDGPVSRAADCVYVAVRLTPRARATRIDSIAHLADGKPVVKISVTAPPAESRANDALLQLLAKEWGVPRRDLAIVAGHKSRNKTVRIAGDAAALLERIAALLAALPQS